MSRFNKIAIITYSRAYNYGSALQTYALNSYLRRLNYDVRTIDYTSDEQRQMYRIFEPLRSAMSVARNVHSLLNYGKMKSHIRRFDEFLSAHVPMTAPMHEAGDLARLNNEFDYFICGSDQIWNVQCCDFNPNYMLAFVNDKNRCIAYAPSLGNGADNQLTADAISEYAAGFGALSSREVAGAGVVAKATGREVPAVVDPVFLLSDKQWSDVASCKLPFEDYVLGYFIGDVAGMRAFAAEVHRKSGLPVVVIYKNLRDIRYGFSNFYECGPAEFVALVKNAKLIVTNSFHAVSFSLIFRRNFWVFIQSGTSDSRVSGILNKVGLTGRIVDVSGNKAIDAMAPVDYSIVDFSGLEKHINESKQFLTDSLK